MFKEALLSKSLRLAFGGSVAFLTLAGSAAFAQTATDSTTQTIERVEITGSNLKRTDTETPSPVQVLTIEDIKKSGYTDVSDVLRNISANGQGTLTQAFSGAFAAGASGIALRGLTVGATLVLIDGHRMAPYALSDDGERSFTDISQIPLAAIERIEILKDGASSIYGSDAIAGVVNIILKKSYIGTEVTVDYGLTSHYDGRTEHTSLITGMGDLDTDGHNVYMSLEYRHQDPIYTSARSGITDLDQSLNGGVDLRPGVPNALNQGFPGSNTGYLVSPTTGLIDGYLPGCNAFLQANNGCRYHNGYPELQPGTQNIDALVSYSQRLWGDWQFNIKASIFDTHAEQVNGYANTSFLSGGPAIVAYGPGEKPTLVAPPTYITVPATYPGNTTGTVQNLVYNFANLGNVTTRADSQQYRLVGDLTGTAWGLDLALSAGFTESVVDQNFLGTYDIPNLQAALNNPITPYRVGLASGLNTAAQNAFVSPPTSQRATDILEFASLQASKDIFQLPGGPASVGVGLDFFHRELDSEAAPGAANGTEASTNDAFAVGNQNVSAAYIEGAFPIFKIFEIDASARVDDYQGTGSSTNPKIGFKFDPIPQVTFRGTYSTGFRAPNPAENGQAGEAFFFTTLADPVLCPNPGTKAVPNTSAAGNFGTQCNVGLLGLQTPGTDLQPEKSKSYTLGVILEPVKQFNLSIDYFDIKIDHQIISAEADPTYDPFNFIVRGNPIVAPFNIANGVSVPQTTPVGPIVYAPFPYENAAFTKTNGVDLDARFKFDFDQYGKITADLTESHTFNYKEAFGAGSQAVQLAGTHGPTSISGDTGNPRDRAQFVLTYERGPLSVTGTVNWISSFAVTDPSEGQTTCADGLNRSFNGPAFPSSAPSQFCNISSFTTLDLYATYQITKAWSVHASILNVANNQAPYDFETYGGGGGAFYDAALDQAGAVGRFYSIGATMKF